MAIHLIPLVAGAAIGSLVTYLYKDEKARANMSRTAGDVSDKVKGAAGAVSDKVSEGISELRGKMTRQAPEEAPTTTKKRVTRKKTAAKKASKKRVAKKKVAAKAEAESESGGAAA